MSRVFAEFNRPVFSVTRYPLGKIRKVGKTWRMGVDGLLGKGLRLLKPEQRPFPDVTENTTDVTESLAWEGSLKSLTSKVPQGCDSREFVEISHLRVVPF